MAGAINDYIAEAARAGVEVPAALQSIIDKMGELGLLGTVSNIAAEAGYKTIADLQAVADKAKAVYDYMVESGQYGTAELAKAWDAYTAAADTALTGEAKKFSDQLKALDTELKGLTASVSAEATEDVMGVIETQQRARIAEIEAEQAKLKAQQAAAEEVSASVTDTAQKDYAALFATVVDDSGTAAAEVARQWARAPWADWPDPPVYTAPVYGGAQAAGGDYLVTRPTLFLAGEAGVERATFSGAGRTGFGGGASRPIEITIHMAPQQMDGRVVAEIQTPYVVKLIPEELLLAGN
jgi:hypothetical protein